MRWSNSPRGWSKPKAGAEFQTVSPYTALDSMAERLNDDNAQFEDSVVLIFEVIQCKMAASYRVTRSNISRIRQSSNIALEFTYAVTQAGECVELKLHQLSRAKSRSYRRSDDTTVVGGISVHVDVT
jgi:hypothetical protein